jgi:transposase
MTHTHIGVDLSKHRLDIYHPETGHHAVANSDKALKAWLSRLAPEEVPVFEATSGCDGRLMRQAAALGREVVRVNPLQAWHFAQSLNLPKTDRVDAMMLERMGRERRLAPRPAFAADQAELAELNGRRDQLKRMETQEKNRLSKTFSTPIKADIRAHLRQLAKRVAQVETRITAFLEAHPELARAAALLESIPGIGRVASVTLLSLMPELGQCDRRAVASLGGLAPKARESGMWKGDRRIGAGRRQVRRALYMAAITTLRHGSLDPERVARMRAQGKPGKVIAIALARKILTIANAVMREAKPYKSTL